MAGIVPHSEVFDAGVCRSPLRISDMAASQAHVIGAVSYLEPYITNFTAEFLDESIFYIVVTRICGAAKTCSILNKELAISITITLY
jgi:hypothetical protein